MRPLDRLADTAHGDTVGNTLAQITRSFPCLRDQVACKYVVGDDLAALHDRDDLLGALKAIAAEDSNVGSGCRHAALFVLAVYNDRAFPHFRLMPAMAAWDNEHRRAFVRWAADPRWM